MASEKNLPWYREVTRYQWLVLLIACLGWIFDQFESQIFVASMNEAIPSLVPKETPRATIDFLNDIALGAFLLGGAMGGIIFGILSDKLGRKRTLALTILFYSAFTCLSAFAGAWWELAICRFLVAMGVGGEWAVASTLVAEVFPKKARPHVGAIFHATSILGTFLAVAAGLFILGNPLITDYAAHLGYPSLPWRVGFAIGALPAFLILWVRRSIQEPEEWLKAKANPAAATEKLGSLTELFSSGLARKTILATLLATVGLATFWGTHIRGKDLLRAVVAKETPTPSDAATNLTSQATLKRWEMLGMFLVTIGGGIGLVSFGPLCAKLGRRPTFALFHIAAFAASLALFQREWSTQSLLIALPLFGFLTLGMHAGYAVYFPELYPTRLRGSGAGFCFNAGRVLAAPIIFARGWMQKDWGYSLEQASTLLAWLFLAGLVILPFLPETKDQDLPD